MYAIVAYNVLHVRMSYAKGLLITFLLTFTYLLIYLRLLTYLLTYLLTSTYFYLLTY